MVSAIEQGMPFQLRHVAKCRDRSAPVIEANYLKKVYDRTGLMTSLRGAVQLKVLKYSDIKDRSAPKIDPTVHIRFVERKAFLDTVLGGAYNFYERLLGAVSNISASSIKAKAGELYEKGLSTANGVSAVAQAKAQTAQEKAGGIIVNVKENASEILEAGKDTAHAAQVRATELIESGQVKAAAVRSTASRKVASARFTWNDLYTSGKEKLLSRQSVETRSDVHRALLADIKVNRQVLLNHVASKDIKDCSKPFLPSAEAMARGPALLRITETRSRVLSEIQHKATLKSLNHVSTRDCSKPAISSQINLHKADRKALLAEVKAESVTLHPTTEVCDRSAPAIPQGHIDLQKNPRKVLLGEVQKGIELAPNKLVLDRSAPQLPSM